MTGSVRLKVSREMRDIKVQVSLTYFESYSLFDEDGQVVIASKNYKKKLIKQELEASQTELFSVGDHQIQIGLRIPSKLTNGTFYHSGETLNARLTYKISAKLFEKLSRANSLSDEPGLREYRAETFVKVCNHFK